MSDSNEYETVISISAEGDPKGVDVFTDSLKKLKEEASGSNAALEKSANQAKQAASGMAEASSSAGRLGDAQEKATQKADGWFGSTRKGLESVSRGVGMLTRLTTLFGIPAAITSAINLVKTLNDQLEETKKKADAAALRMQQLDISDFVRQSEALAAAQERSAAALARQYEGMRRISEAKTAEQDSGYAADLAELDASEQQALAQSMAQDKTNEAGRAEITADFARRRRKLARERDLAGKKSAVDQATLGADAAKKTVDDRSNDVTQTSGKLSDVERKIAEQLARAEKAFNPSTAPKETRATAYGTSTWIDRNEQKRISDEVNNLLYGENGLAKVKSDLQKKLSDQKAALEDAVRSVPAAESNARKAKTDYESAASTSKRRDDALDAMDALRVDEAKRRQHDEFSRSQAAETWKGVDEQDRLGADAKLPGMYRRLGELERSKIGIESKEVDARSALEKLRADEGTTRWKADQAYRDPSLTPKQRTEQSEALNKKADSIAANARRMEAMLQTIDASWSNVAAALERLAAKIRDTESRSTAGSADVFQP